MNPAAVASQVIFNIEDRTTQYCNGTDWITFPKGATAAAPCIGAGDWTQRTMSQSPGFTSVAYGNGRFVAVSYDNTASVLATSPDGMNWTTLTQMFGQWRDVTYGGGQFVAVAHWSGGTNSVATSPDGLTWTVRTAASADSWQSVAYGNGLYVAMGNTVLMTSPDAINWSMGPPVAGNGYSITYGSGMFVAVGNGIIMSSPDGINWTSRPIPDGYTNLHSVTYGNGLFVAVAGNLHVSILPERRVLTSPDGITWTRRTAFDSVWRSVTYGNGLFVAVAESGTTRIMTSPDGIVWTAQAAPATNQWRTVTYGGGLFVAMAYDGTNPVMTGKCVMPGCTNPARDAGVIIFNSSHRVLQYCDGAAWQPAGPIDPPGAGVACTNPVRDAGAIIFNEQFRVLQYCDGTIWRVVGRFPCTSCGGSPDEKVAFYTLNGASISALATDWGGGVAGADALCQSRASAAGLRGNYLAWIADANAASAPASRFTHSSVPYVRVDGVKVADDWADLTDGSLDNSMISETEFVPAVINGVWSNVATDGTRISADPAYHCNNWTNGGVTGSIGTRNSTTSTWTDYQQGSSPCGAGYRFYCFEQ